MLSEEKQAVENLEKLVKLRKNIRGEITHDTCICGTSDLDTVLNLITKLQKENKEKDNRARKIIKRLDNDYKRITETKTNKSTFPNYLDDYTRCRLKAYRTKTREIKEYIEQEYFENKAKEKGE